MLSRLLLLVISKILAIIYFFVIVSVRSRGSVFHETPVGELMAEGEFLILATMNIKVCDTNFTNFLNFE